MYVLDLGLLYIFYILFHIILYNLYILKTLYIYILFLFYICYLIKIVYQFNVFNSVSATPKVYNVINLNLTSSHLSSI